MGNKEAKNAKGVMKCITCGIALELSLALIKRGVKRYLEEDEYRKNITGRKDYR